MRRKSPRHNENHPHMESLESRLLMSTWYVRPWQSNDVKYGAGTGATYADAWAGFTKIVWGTGGVVAGDTLYVCGTHPDLKDNLAGQSLNNRDTSLVVQASGTSDLNRITIRGDYAGDAGRIIRITTPFVFDKSNPAGKGWSDPEGDGIYTRSAFSSVTNPLETDYATGTIYQLTCAKASPTDDPTQWTGNGIAGVFGGTYYYKPRTETTKSMVYTNGVSRAVSIVGQDYVTVKSLELYGGTSSEGLMYLTDGSDHVLLDSLTFKYSGYMGICINRKTADGLSNEGAPCNYGEIRNCYLTKFTTGVYFISPPQRHTGWWIHNNTLENGYQHDEMGLADSHGIMLEGGNDHVVEYNVIKHVSTAGLGVDIKNDTPNSNLILRYNWVEDVSSNPSRLDNMAFGASGSAYYPDVKINNQLYSNVLIGGAVQGIHGSIFQRQSSPDVGKPWLVANNLLVNNGYINPVPQYYVPCTLYFGETINDDGSVYRSAFTFENNILASSGAQHIYGRSVYGLDDRHVIDYNLYDAEGYQKWFAGYYDGTDHYYSTLSAWRAGQGKDLHSPSAADPGFVNRAGSDYRLQWNSPAIDAGTQWWVAADIHDYYGNLIDMTDFNGLPIYGTPDIGPFEYQPPYLMGTDTIAANSTVRVYADGKFRQLTTAGATAASLSVAPAAGWGTFTNTQQRAAWMDLAVSTWQTTGTYARVWTETGGTLGSTATAHVVGGLEPNTNYNLAVNGVWGSGVSGSGVAGGLVRSNASGQITFTYSGGYVSAPTFALAKAVWGDFNNDGLVNAADIDTMMAEIRTAGNRSPFDLTLDAQVSQADADNLVQTVLHTIYGDADLNGMVDQRDYAAWFGHNGLTAGWAGGNFTSDTLVDQQDFAQWFNHNGLSASQSPATLQGSTSESLLGLADVPTTQPAKVSWTNSTTQDSGDLLDLLSMPALGSALG